MNLSFKNTLSEEEKVKVNEFYNSLKNVAVEQNLDWNEIVPSGKNCSYFYASDNNRIQAFAIINEESFLGIVRYASIRFGPVFNEPDVLIEGIKEIIRHYRKKRYMHLSVLLPIIYITPIFRALMNGLNELKNG